MSKFSDRLVYLRKRDRLSQQELATKLGVSRSVVGMYETGQRMPSFEVLEAIADTFNVNISFLIGQVDNGEYSRTFRNNLAAVLENRPKSDLSAAGINEYELGLIINGSVPLTFDHACEICDQLGESLDMMLQDKEKTATPEDDGLGELRSIYSLLSPDNRSKLIELSRLFLTAQHNNGEKK